MPLSLRKAGEELGVNKNTVKDRIVKAAEKMATSYETLALHHEALVMERK